MALLARLRKLQFRYHRVGMAAFEVVATLVFAASQIYAPISSYLTRAGTLTYPTSLVALDISLTTSRIDSQSVAITALHDHDDLMAALMTTARQSLGSSADLLEY